MKKRTACLFTLMLAMTTALTGCTGVNKLDNSAEAASVDGVSIPLGEVNFLLRYQQTQMSAYSSYFGEDFMNQDLSGSGSIYCRYSGRVLSGGGACRRTGRISQR